MRESRTYGSVRGALSNERPYRDRFARNDGWGNELRISRMSPAGPKTEPNASDGIVVQGA